jgi:hypothetical protein
VALAIAGSYATLARQTPTDRSELLARADTLPGVDLAPSKDTATEEPVAKCRVKPLRERGETR